MSGREVVFHGLAMAGVVHALADVSAQLGELPVVIGGLAVVTRLSTAYRATVDLDLVDRRSSGREPHLEVLRRAPGAEPTEPAAVTLPTPYGSVRVDVLEVNQAELDHPSDDSGDRLHASAHAWASETASEVTIVVMGDRREIFESIPSLIAQPGPLIAMKLQSVMDRGDAKAGTDLLDVVRLVLDRECGHEALSEITSCPPQMAADIAEHVVGWFEARRLWSLRRIRAAGGSDVTIDDVELVVELLLGACDRRPAGRGPA